jgi:hypothetical protein
MYFHTIDIAHPPLTADITEKVLDEEAGKVFSSQNWRVLKVIHGYGTDKRPAILKQVVLTGLIAIESIYWRLFLERITVVLMQKHKKCASNAVRRRTLILTHQILE